MIRVFCGYDSREAFGFHVFTESLIRHASEPVSIIPLTGEQRDATNRFGHARFLVPYLCDFKGTAIFLDASDMLMRADIAELAKLADPQYAVQVVQHAYQTLHPRKYLGTEMEAPNADYPRKNWSSVVIWNCEHWNNAWLEPHVVQEMTGGFLHRFSWLRDEHIGTLPAEWNALIGEQHVLEPKVAHFTLGIPAIDHYKDWDYAQEWQQAASQAMTVPAAKDTAVGVQ